MGLKSEQIIQINLVNWFKETYPEFADDLHHFVNEGKRSYNEGRTLKRMGLTKGVSDLFLAVPINNYHGLWLEIKTISGKLSNEQIEFINRKNKKGYIAVATWGYEAAKEVIIAYLKDHPFQMHGC